MSDLDPTTFPEPYFDRDTWLALRRQIEKDNVEPDPFLKEDPETPVYGFNLAFAWPFPASIKKRYEELSCDLSKLGSGVFVYPYEQTHVTVMTLVNFKKHQQPTATEIASLQRLVSPIVSKLQSILASPRVAAFSVDIGPPILSRKAAFLPMLDASQVVSGIRAAAEPVLSELLGKQIAIPGIIHSTILRFSRQQPDATRLLERFDEAAGHRIGRAEISELLLTSETQPYMRAGEILHRFTLPERPC